MGNAVALRVLALDGGSSSIKYAAFDIDAESEAEILRGSVEIEAERRDSRRRALARIVADVQRRDFAPEAIGHRIVFAGEVHVQPERVTTALVDDLRGLVTLDPLHAPVAIETIEAAQQAFPGIAQIACYDTAFHASLPEAAKRLPLPEGDGAIRRYGFHGLSYEYVVWKLGDRATGRVVAAHLGNGASVTAIRDGRSIDTSMGMTPLGGTMMGTRTGDIDPGVVLYLLRSGLGIEDVAALLTERSGLLGVSGRTSDMRELLQLERQDGRAALAVEMFAYQARKWIAAMAAALNGIDRLVFTGGIGEGSPEIRERICAGLRHLGVGSTVPVEVVATDENLIVARHAARQMDHSQTFQNGVTA